MLTEPVQNVEQWKQQLKDYEVGRTSTSWNQQPGVERINAKVIKERDVRYNPVLQKYNDPGFESKLRETERQGALMQLAKNKDRALRYEQTYNVINFENKLKGMENHPDYPKEKPWYFRPNPDSVAEYNILSNLPLHQHHYAAPDKRPKPVVKVEKVKKTTTTGLRDYNIINNRYKENHELKTKVDFEVERAEAALKYWKTHDFNPVNTEYFDPNKEQEFVQHRTSEAKVHGLDQIQRLPISVRNEGMLYNPVNMKIEDDQRLYERDLREKNKKKRYEVRFDMERQYHERNAINQEREKKMRIAKIAHDRFIEERKRGFHILTNDPLYGPKATKTLYNPHTKPKANGWDRVVANAQGGEPEELGQDFEQQRNLMATLQGNQLRSEHGRRAQSVVVPSSRRSLASKAGEAVLSSKASSKLESPRPEITSTQGAPVISSHRSVAQPASIRSEVSRRSIPLSHASRRSQGAEGGNLRETMTSAQSQHLQHLNRSAALPPTSGAAPSKASSGLSRASRMVENAPQSKASAKTHTTRSVRTGGFQRFDQAAAAFF